MPSRFPPMARGVQSFRVKNSAPAEEAFGLGVVRAARDVRLARGAAHPLTAAGGAL
jgi:hypothetical protein